MPAKKKPVEHKVAPKHEPEPEPETIVTAKQPVMVTEVEPGPEPELEPEPVLIPYYGVEHSAIPAKRHASDRLYRVGHTYRVTPGTILDGEIELQWPE